MRTLENTPSPGASLQTYLAEVEHGLTLYRTGEASWAEMMDWRERAAATLNGRLVDHYLVRAHNQASLMMKAPPPTAARDMFSWLTPSQAGTPDVASGPEPADSGPGTGGHA